MAYVIFNSHSRLSLESGGRALGRPCSPAQLSAGPSHLSNPALPPVQDRAGTLHVSRVCSHDVDCILSVVAIPRIAPKAELIQDADVVSQFHAVSLHSRSWDA